MSNNQVTMQKNALKLKTIYIRVNNLQKSLSFFRNLGFTSTHIEIDAFDRILVYLITSGNYSYKEQETHFCIYEFSLELDNPIMFGFKSIDTSYVDTLFMLNEAGVKIKNLNPTDLEHHSHTYQYHYYDFEGILENFRIENISYEKLQSNHYKQLVQNYGPVDKIAEVESYANNLWDIYSGVDGLIAAILIKVANIDEYISSLEYIGFSPSNLETKDDKIVKVQFILNQITNLKLIIQQDAACINNNDITFLVGESTRFAHIVDSSNSIFFDELENDGGLKLNRNVMGDDGIIMPHFASYTDLNEVKWLFFNSNEVTI